MAENKRLPELLNTDSIVVSLMESTNGTIRIRNKALLLDEETGNGRIYPLSVVSEAIKEAEPRMRAGECLCTVNGHPADVYPEPDIASHYVVKAWIEGKYLMCESVVMGDTQYGKTLMGLITGGAAIGISVRGTGAVNGNKVSSYQFEGFDFVGTPSTGLRAKPEIVTDKKKSTYAESMQDDKVVDYICENVVNNQVKQSERNVMAEQTSFKEFQAVMQESVKHIKGSRSISDAHSRIAMVESKFPTLNIDVKSAAFGQASINEVFREWDEEKSSVVNSFETKPEQETTNGGAGENKDSMQMKDATKESAESIQESKNKAVRLAKHLRNTQVDLFRESKRVVGISAVAAKDKKSLTEAKRLLSEATTRVASAQQRLVSESTKSAKLADENAKLREALMATRKESIALKVIKESQAKATARVSRRERQLMRENAELKKVASDLNAEVGNESSLEVRASNVCAALEMALEESVTKCVTLERQLKEERKKNLQK